MRRFEVFNEVAVSWPWAHKQIVLEAKDITLIVSLSHQVAAYKTLVNLVRAQSSLPEVLRLLIAFI